MKVYLDIVLFLNIAFDFLLLLSVNLLLRRNVKITDLLSGAVIGGGSIIFLFWKLNSLQLMLLKIVVSILMILITFGYRSIKYSLKNIGYLYLTSILFGGILYFLNVQFSYKQKGLIFYHNGLSVNFYFLVLTSPILLYIYIKQLIHLKHNYSNYHKVTFNYEDKKLELNGFLDTGNKLVEPISRKPIILVNGARAPTEWKEYKTIIVPFSTASGTSMIRCIKIDSIYIKKIGKKKKFYIGLLDENIKIDGIDCILNLRVLEGK